MNFHTDGKPAPGQLEIVHAFLNTFSEELGFEDLGDAKAASGWLRSAGLLSAQAELKESDCAVLRNFREDLRGVVRDGGGFASLNPYLQGLNFELAADQDGSLQLLPGVDGVQQALGGLLGIIYNSVTDGTWTRFKCCQLPSCGWAFYDYSKNRSGRWCSMKTCGSRHKARQYLRRKAAQ